MALPALASLNAQIAHVRASRSAAEKKGKSLRSYDQQLTSLRAKVRAIHAATASRAAPRAKQRTRAANAGRKTQLRGKSSSTPNASIGVVYQTPSRQSNVYTDPSPSSPADVLGDPYLQALLLTGAAGTAFYNKDRLASTAVNQVQRIKARFAPSPTKADYTAAKIFEDDSVEPTVIGATQPAVPSGLRQRSNVTTATSEIGEEDPLLGASDAHVIDMAGSSSVPAPSVIGASQTDVATSSAYVPNPAAIQESEQITENTGLLSEIGAGVEEALETVAEFAPEALLAKPPLHADCPYHILAEAYANMPRIGPVRTKNGIEFYRPERASLAAALAQLHAVVGTHPEVDMAALRAGTSLTSANLDAKGPTLSLNVPIKFNVRVTAGSDSSVEMHYKCVTHLASNFDYTSSSLSEQAFIVGRSAVSSLAIVPALSDAQASELNGFGPTSLLPENAMISVTPSYDDYSRGVSYSSPVMRIKGLTLKATSSVGLEVFIGDILDNGAGRTAANPMKSGVATSVSQTVEASHLWATNLKDAIKLATFPAFRVTIPPSQYPPVANNKGVGIVTTSLNFELTILCEQRFSSEQMLTTKQVYWDTNANLMHQRRRTYAQAMFPHLVKDWTEGMTGPESYGQFADTRLENETLCIARTLFVPTPNFHSWKYFMGHWEYQQSGRFVDGTPLTPELSPYLQSTGGLPTDVTQPMWDVGKYPEPANNFISYSQFCAGVWGTKVALSPKYHDPDYYDAVRPEDKDLHKKYLLERCPKEDVAAMEAILDCDQSDFAEEETLQEPDKGRAHV